MKKVLSISLFALLLVFGFAQQAKAEGEIEIYPYDKIECLQALDTCTNYKVGDSYWDLTYNGFNYNFVNGAVRYASEFSDDNLDGNIDPLDGEMAAIGWNGFSGLIINNTANEVVIDTTNARVDITTVVHRTYVYFDENGTLAMLEDHYLNPTYLHNDGTAEAPDWRLATEAEITAYEAEVTAETIAKGDLSAAGTMFESVRIKLDDVDTDGYIAEPVGHLVWEMAGVDKGVLTDPEDWSVVVAGDPNLVTLPAGWSVMTIGTLDRNNTNSKSMDFLAGLVEAMVDPATEDAMIVYVDQPAWFSGLTALDDDAGTPGVNIVVDFNGEFDLDPTVEAAWRNMYDDTDQSIINSVEMLDYSVTISQDGMDLETIDFVYNETTELFEASAAVTVIDSAEFGAGYTATYAVTTPEGELTEVEVDVVIGVMPPKFIGVEDQYVNEGMYIDLMAGIMADDGYGNDETNLIELTKPATFNPYSPLPGVYDIDLEYVHHVHFDGHTPQLHFTEDNSTQSGGSDMTHDYEWADGILLNEDKNISECGTVVCVWTDLTHFTDATTGWSSVVVLVGADGKLDFMYERYGWTYTDENGFKQAGSEADFLAWQAALVLEDGAYVIGSHGTANPGYYLRYTEYDAVIDFDWELIPDFDYDIVTTESFTVTVDDITAPQIIAVNDEYTIMVGQFTNVNKAILSNVAAFDNYDMLDDLAIYVSDNGGLSLTSPATYTVEVTVEDMAGNSAMVEFDVTVKPVTVYATPAQIAELEAEIAALEALLDAQLTEAQIQALIDAEPGPRTDAEIQALIDAAIDEIPEVETGCGSSIGNSLLVYITGAIALMGGAALFFMKRS